MESLIKLDKTTAISYHTMPSTNLQGHSSKSKRLADASHYVIFHLSINKNKFRFLRAPHSFLCTRLPSRNSTVHPDIQSLWFALMIRSFQALNLNQVWVTH